MNCYYKVDEWKVIEEGFDPSMQMSSESIFSLGNGRMGQRANFEEDYSGETFQGTYIAGVYYPDKTRVGWWKNGYPEYFAKVLNAPDWIGIRVEIDKERLDLHKAEILDFYRELNMKEGYLLRKFRVKLLSGKELEVMARRFLSISNDEIGVVNYRVRALNFEGELSFIPFIDGDVKNRDANYDEYFWDILGTDSREESAYLHARTKKSGFEVCMTMMNTVLVNGSLKEIDPMIVVREKYSAQKYSVMLKERDTATLIKYVSVVSSLNYPSEKLVSEGRASVRKAYAEGYDKLFSDHCALWDEKWSHSDIIIKGDPSAQQGIRFNIFHLNQTYTGEDERLNIGPKGFTGEKYGGSTYWDTEAYLIPFYLSTAPEKVSRNLLIYRYKHLQKAIENAEKLGFSGGAALYPMVTMNGEECHNEWEITFEEIHRNGAIAYAIYNYIRYTEDRKYLAEYGLEVLIAISRFWRQRVNWSDVKGKYVMLGVTGPNEYENNVNNNWYTNKMAVWTLSYTLEAIDYVLEEHPEDYSRIVEASGLDYEKETAQWRDIIEHMYFPYSEKLGVFLQQDGYLDKEQLKVAELKKADRPLNQKWSWDRTLRSVFIKQADVLQGIYTFEDEYPLDVIRRNYDFYEPRTVHESSLSPCIHSILAIRLGYHKRAYELYLRTSRLDLDDYNHEVDEGLHITSMGGTWMSIVYGFGGMRIRDNRLQFNPSVPANWESLSFRIMFRDNVIRINLGAVQAEIRNESGPDLELYLHEEFVRCGSGETIRHKLPALQEKAE